MSPAHPRVGGENVEGVLLAATKGGSSPRGRGKRLPVRIPSHGAGLIPAWAGKTRSSACQGRNNRAHPRVGGENRWIWRARRSRSGSSPRGRGKLEDAVAAPVEDGLIPAWAGKTMGHGRRHHDGQAHPRVGGENAAMMRSVLPIQGSSPRGRGKPSTRPCKHSRDSAHPRVGGENAEDQTRNVYEPGSSPRGRGKR